MIDQVYSDLRDTCGGVRNDYFGLLYLEREFGVPRDKAINQIAFGGNDYGIDGFHFDAQRHNLYLFQFKWSNSYTQFKPSLQRLIECGMERIFVAPNVDVSKNQLLLQLRSCMVENRAIIDQVCVRFVFTGDPAQAERSSRFGTLAGAGGSGTGQGGARTVAAPDQRRLLFSHSQHFPCFWFV
ncbi:MAG: hypothetical protein K6U02_11555 [Firmicutes bacterium]|nr:hypothetical protein [Bacillota bacterium]